MLTLFVIEPITRSLFINYESSKTLVYFMECEGRGKNMFYRFHIGIVKETLKKNVVFFPIPGKQ